MRATLETWFQGREDELADAVSRLAAIDSTIGEPAPGAPFGPGPAAALDEFLALAAEWGLPGENLEGYVGSIDLNGNPDALHVLGHLDVVPAGEGWTVTEAFAPKRAGDLLYGRGVSDDKGPMAAALLAMRAVKELGVPLTKNIKLLLGTDEETGMRDVAWYYNSHPFAPHTLSPDADFPIINIEKGHYQPTFTARWDKETSLPRVIALTGGPRVNMVPPKASATVLGLEAKDVEAVLPGLGLEEAISFAVSPTEGGVTILCNGANAHGSTPEEGHNAQTALVALLAALPLAETPSARAIRALARLFPHGDHLGQGLGIAQADGRSGALSLAFTILNLDEEGCTARFDSRTPLCATEETVKAAADRALEAAGFAVSGEMDPPHHVPAEDPFIATLARVYEDWTGEKAECLAIGGGTYVHDIPGGVAFGANMPGFQCNLHGPDEKVSVEDLMTTAKIYASVMIDLCK